MGAAILKPPITEYTQSIGAYTMKKVNLVLEARPTQFFRFVIFFFYLFWVC